MEEKVCEARRETKEKQKDVHQKVAEKVQHLQDAGRLVQKFEVNNTSNQSNLDRNLRDRVAKFQAILKNVPVDVLSASITAISKEQIKSGVKQEDTYFAQVFKSKQFDKERMSEIRKVAVASTHHTYVCCLPSSLLHVCRHFKKLLPLGTPPWRLMLNSSQMFPIPTWSLSETTATNYMTIHKTPTA